ncbi:MAG: DUF3179 domain-containing (seleno)protein, partial [Bryobacteraceae bacterium]
VFVNHSMLDVLSAATIQESGKTLAVGVFSRELDGKTLTFQHRAGVFLDKQTHSTWNVLGISTKGPLEGKHLKALPHDVAFAFAWLAFYPNTMLVSGAGPIVPDVGESPFSLPQSTNPGARYPSPVPPSANVNPAPR